MPFLKPISILGAVLAVQVMAVTAAFALRASDRILRDKLPYLVSLAVGVLLGTALLHLLPEAISLLGNRSTVWLSLGATMLTLFAIERVLYAVTGVQGEQPDPQRLLREHEALEHGHRHHVPGAGDAGSHGGRTLQPISLAVAGMLHSFVDGATIATAFAASGRIGWLTAFAVALHEIPHRIGDFALFLHLGVGRGRALHYAVLEGVPALVAPAVVLLLGTGGVGAIHWLLPVSAGSFLYIALVNLLPELQIECRLSRVLGQIACLAVGVGLVAAVAGLPG